MTDDADRLAEHTHLTEQEAQLLLDGRHLAGEPEDAEDSIEVTPEKIDVQPSQGLDVRSAEEIAEASGADVETVREGIEAMADMDESND